VHTPPEETRHATLAHVARWGLCGLGITAGVLAAIAAPGPARSAAAQVWPAFVLVGGLVALGVVFAVDGLFAFAGSAIARVRRGPVVLFLASALLVIVVSALANLDTAAAFVTPVVVTAAVHRGLRAAPFVYLTIFLCNGASLLLPGSNLTNVIVFADASGTGLEFASHMALPWCAAVVSVTALVLLGFRRSLRAPTSTTVALVRPSAWRLDAALLAVALVAMVALHSAAAALVVAAAGTAAVVVRMTAGPLAARVLAARLQIPVIAGLFGAATALGTLGRTWSGPATFLAHATSWEAGFAAAGLAVVVNNLPAAALLGARPSAHAYALVCGLNLGPNLAVTGALSAVLWAAALRGAGIRPSAARFTLYGLVVTPVSLAAALGALAVHP
jgi:arsenical pump membrane protein